MPEFPFDFVEGLLVTLGLPTVCCVQFLNLILELLDDNAALVVLVFGIAVLEGLASLEHIANVDVIGLPIASHPGGTCCQLFDQVQFKGIGIPVVVLQGVQEILASQLMGSEVSQIFLHVATHQVQRLPVRIQCLRQ